MNQIKLPYAFNALEPHIDALTMETHYQKQHAALHQKPERRGVQGGPYGKPIEALLSDWKSAVPDDVKMAVRNNGGGFFNHNLYFGHLAPDAGGTPAGALAEKIDFASEAWPPSRADLEGGAGPVRLRLGVAGDRRRRRAPGDGQSQSGQPPLRVAGLWRRSGHRRMGTRLII